MRLGRRKGKTVYCVFCGKEFYSNWRKDHNSYKKFCSPNCANKYRSEKIKVVCLNCEQVIEKVPSQFNLRKWNFCSKKCCYSYLRAHKSPNWKGGVYISQPQTIAGSQYVFVRDKSDKKGKKYRAEHRVIVEQYIGRELAYHSEPVYHLNGDTTDNRPDNLYVFPDSGAMHRELVKGHIPTKSNLDHLKTEAQQ
jgi:hypothetical protein